MRVGAGEVHGPGVFDGLPGEDRVDVFLGAHAVAGAGGVEAGGERDDGGGQRQARVAGGQTGGDGEAAACRVPGESDGRRIYSGVEQGTVGGEGVLDRGRERVLGCEPIVQGVGQTVAAGLAELIGDIVDGSPDAVRAIAELRVTLERNQIGTPTG